MNSFSIYLDGKRGGPMDQSRRVRLDERGGAPEQIIPDSCWLAHLPIIKEKTTDLKKYIFYTNL